MSSPTRAYALRKIAIQETLGDDCRRAATSAEMLQERASGIDGTFWAWCMNSATSRRPGVSGRFLPVDLPSMNKPRTGREIGHESEIFIRERPENDQDELSAKSYQLSAISYQLSAISYGCGKCFGNANSARGFRPWLLTNAPLGLKRREVDIL